MEKILRLPEVLATVGTSRSFVYDQIRTGKFPKPIKLGSRASGWRLSDIEAWIESRRTLSNAKS